MKSKENLNQSFRGAVNILFDMVMLIKNEAMIKIIKENKDNQPCHVVG